jgi:hypothetical protein
VPAESVQANGVHARDAMRNASLAGETLVHS